MGIGMKLLHGIGNGFSTAGRGIKSFSMRWAGAGYSYLSTIIMPRSSFNYAQEMGDGSKSNIVQAVVAWIARTFPEAPVMVVQEQPDGTKERIHGHRLPKLLEKPNPYYSGVLLWMATLVDWSLAGNAYWIKERVKGGPFDGMVDRLWWAPEWTMEPAFDDKTYITHYDYRPDSASDAIPLRPEDVVHFRYGMDSANTRKGCSPLRTLLKEIFTDEEAANFTAALMKNLAVPGVIISPDGANHITEEQANLTKSTFIEKFGGDKRGEPMVQLSATKVQVLSFSPEQMMLRDLRRVPEERITAIYGVAAVVVGLGAGLDRATFANFAEAREAAYEGNIIPTQRLMAADLTLQLLPDFTSDENASIEFDLTNVRVLQPDMDKVAERFDKAIRNGWAMRSTGLRALGLPATPDDDVYYVSKNVDIKDPNNTPFGEEVVGAAQVQATALNGAQIASLLEVLLAVTNGGLASDTAAGVLRAGFPSLTEEEIARMVTSADSFEPETPILPAPPKELTPSTNGHSREAVPV